ncbi:solute carrier family 20 (sodium-dependent phosphate transporter) [Strigomonas culicis]|uniref:Phosphate transporter n=1 Tax=Strigomonas culicis TaxID=28005 RepID=S9TM49_9TRYP|nr:solute carrier family 20 (sodium-dependent phosphate transporter) [Strigomonas culicis]|eukprot:EPY19302.1 solute carrier family 20 (sodium-dependent phosphate transporter) [Strigomonas culicis]
MNDLANSFGTTYGARILTLFQICILASICEFAGAVSLGGAVTSTISGGIASTDNFKSEPYLFMYGMLCASGAAFLWLAVATYYVLPVSSTHSIVGGVIGFALVHGGKSSVKWASPASDFPYFGGVAPVIASWFISPLLTGVVTAILYCSVKYAVLMHQNSVKRAVWALPIIVGFAFFLESFLILFKGAAKRLHWKVGKALWVSAIIGAGVAAVTCALVPLMKRLIRRRQRERAEAEAAAAAEPIGDGHSTRSGARASARAGDESGNALPPVDAAAKPGAVPSAEGAVVRDDDESDDAGAAASDVAVEVPADPHADVMRYDNDAEYIFRYLQVFTAMCASFAHGASDVSNAVGPFAAIYGIYQSGSVTFSKNTPIWILCIGGAGLVVGLSTFGIRLMRLLGETITLITPSRGFSAELAAALVVSFASGYGIPVSSTHCITGGVVAVSIIDKGFMNINWKMVLKMYFGWVFTLVITAVMSAAFYAQGAYSPIE